VGLAAAGLLPVPEIQFRKYAEPRWSRSTIAARCAGAPTTGSPRPMVLRMPIGFLKCGDPWHSQTNEVQFVHNPGWLVAVPSNAEDAVGLLRARCAATTRRCSWSIARCWTTAGLGGPGPGDAYVLPFGRARKTRQGEAISIITWGAMVPRCEEGAGRHVRRRHRPAYLGAVGPRDGAGERAPHPPLPDRPRGSALGRLRREIAAVVADEAFLDLDAPVARVTMPDIPSPHNPALLEWAVPSVADIRARIDELVGF
jgi:2-oxoisovalerate dehydrogenase E1 component